MLPDFAIIGAQKSASTFLHECLVEHPEVYIPHEETAFFEDHLYRADDLSWLEKRFENEAARKASRRGIKRPNYLAIPQCAERIAKHLPEIQLMMVLRHPVSRFVSAWFHYIKAGYVPALPIEEGITAILEGRLVRDYPRSRELIEFGFYDKHLANYFSVFPRDVSMFRKTAR